MGVPSGFPSTVLQSMTTAPNTNTTQMLPSSTNGSRGTIPSTIPQTVNSPSLTSSRTQFLGGTDGTVSILTATFITMGQMSIEGGAGGIAEGAIGE